MTDMIKCQIIEDNPNYRESLKHMMEASKRIEFAGDYSCAESYLEDLPNFGNGEIQVVLLDLSLPGKNGMQIIPIIKNKHAKSQILVLTQDDDYHTAIEAIQLGVSGYLLKHSPISQIREAIVQVSEGDCLIDPKLSKVILNTLCSGSLAEEDNILTKKEQRVLELLALGFVKKEVADQMKVSYRTVTQYTENIYKKLRVPNVAAAVGKAIRKGLI